jgi:hypothetical protein
LQQDQDLRQNRALLDALNYRWLSFLGAIAQPLAIPTHQTCEIPLGMQQSDLDADYPVTQGQQHMLDTPE